MKLKNLTLMLFFLMGLATFISCEKTSLDENIEDAAERTGAAVKDVGDAAGDAVHDATH